MGYARGYYEDNNDYIFVFHGEDFRVSKTFYILVRYDDKYCIYDKG